MLKLSKPHCVRNNGLNFKGAPHVTCRISLETLFLFAMIIAEMEFKNKCEYNVLQLLDLDSQHFLIHANWPFVSLASWNHREGANRSNNMVNKLWMWICALRNLRQIEAAASNSQRRTGLNMYLVSCENALIRCTVAFSLFVKPNSVKLGSLSVSCSWMFLKHPKSNSNVHKNSTSITFYLYNTHNGIHLWIHTWIHVAI